MSDEDGITLRGTSFTVSASEKVSTGQYENYNPHLTLEGEIPKEELTDEAREDLKEQLPSLHGDLQAVLNKAAGNRTADAEFEDWTSGDEGPVAKSAEEVDHAVDGGQTDE
jgi:hypothetical protein